MKAIILAAGKGKRMQSDLQKVMHPILGKPIVQYAVEAAKEAGFTDITVVIGSDGEEIKKGLSATNKDLHFAIQEVALGTGNAVQAGAGRIQPTDEVLILCGDMPLVTSDFIKEMMQYNHAEKSDAVVAAVYLPTPSDFGRVYDENGDFTEIVEARDITPSHTKTDWANTGVFLFKGDALLNALGKITNNNNQNEYYLTDAPKILREEGKCVKVFHTRETLAVFTGINTQIHLAEAVAHMRNRINARHMLNGVRMLDPTTVFIDDTVKIARGVVIYPNVILEGDCEISANATIGMNTHLTNTKVCANAHIRQSVATNATIGAKTEVGPFAYLRPNAVIGDRCRIGNFVEVKNATLGDDTKMAHLAYIGDAEVGENVNYGCGAITANYDGKNKHITKIGDNAFIGSNSNLIAPVEIGKDGFVAAGSTITNNLPPNALGIARERQCIIPDWKRPSK